MVIREPAEITCSNGRRCCRRTINFANATAVTDAFGFRNDFNTGATAEAGEPHAGNSIWYRWTAPRNMQAEFSTAGSEFDTFLAIYTGSALGVARGNCRQ